MKNTLRKCTLALICLLSFSSLTFASHIKGEREVNITTRLDDNAYLAGGNININAPIDGDLLCAGGQVVVSDTIFDDAIIGGGNINIKGVIMGDLRIAGGEVTISNRIGGDLIVTGGNVKIGENVVIGGDMILASGDVEMLGVVEGKMQAYCGNLLFDGKVGGDADIKCGNFELNGEIRGDAIIAANRIDLGIDPGLYGRVKYWTRDGEMNFGSTLKSDAELVYNPDLKFEMNDGNYNRGAGSSWFFWTWRVFGAALFIALLCLLFNRFFDKVGENLPDNISTDVVNGLLYFFLLPVVAAMLLITVIGIPIGLFALFFYVFSMLFAKAITATVGAYGAKYYLDKDWNFGLMILVGLGIYILLLLIDMIPFLGGWLVFILALIAFGAIITRLRSRTTKQAQEYV